MFATSPATTPCCASSPSANTTCRSAPTSAACCAALFEHLEDKLGIGHKGTTADGLFSLEEVECIGVCCWAPAIQVNYDFHDDLTNDKVDAVLNSYRAKAKGEATNA
jgi:NADH:ubiquinone oxidoreductase subunit E